MEFVFLITALAGLIWLAVAMARGGVLVGCGLVMLAGCCFGHPFFNISMPGLPLTLDRALLAAVVLQSLLYRLWGWRSSRPLQRGDWIALALITALGISLATHNWQFRNGAPLAQFLFFYVTPIILYWTVRSTHISPRQCQWLVGAFAIFGFYLAVTAILEVKFGGAFVFPHYITSPSFDEFLGRARGPFLNPAANGIYLASGACASLLFWPHMGRVGRLGLVVLALPLFAVGLYCTLTRSAWMGGLLAVAIVGLLALPRGARLPVFVGGTLVGVVVVAASWDSLMTYKRDKALDAEETAESARLRPILATVAWQMFQDRPLFGFGYGQYLSENSPYLSRRDSDLPLEKARAFVQHNVILALLVETGLLGAGLWGCLLAYWAVVAWRLWHDAEMPLTVRQIGLLQLAAMGCYFPNAMFQDCSIIPMVNMLLFFVAGLTQAAIATHSESFAPTDAREYRVTGDGRARGALVASA